MRKAIAIAIAAILVLVLGYWGYSTYLGPSASPIPTPEPEQVEKVVSATGTVLPTRWANLAFESGGRVKSILVQEGDQVKAGAALIQLETGDLENALAQAEANLRLNQALLDQLEIGARVQVLEQAEANLEVAEANLEHLRNGATEEQRVAARAALDEATVALQLAQAQYDTIAWRSDAGAYPQSVALAQATSAHDIASANYQALLKGPSPEEITAAEAQVEAAQAQLDLLKAGATDEELAVAQARVDLAQAAVQQARLVLGKATLRAPFDATIGDVTIREGEIAAPGVPVVIIGDLEGLRIETTDLNEIDINLVKVGQKAKMTFDALPEKVLLGHVGLISPMANLTEGGTNYTVIIELDGPDPALRWGMTAFVDILPEE